MKTSDFDYFLPQELIAQAPASIRDESRLMIINPRNQTIEHRKFSDIVDYLYPEDLLVLNDTKVVPCRLMGRKAEGSAKIDALLLSRITGHKSRIIYECLVKPGKRLKIGSQVIFGEGELTGTVLGKKEDGEQIIEFQCDGKFEDVIERLGEIPLPPYVRPKTKDQKQRYQTVYAKKPGAAAAPTAGLHFTVELLEKINAKRIKVAYVTLHTGLATFRPVYAENVEEHKMHKESYSIENKTREDINKAKRVIAVGTTTVRALESSCQRIIKESTENILSAETDLFIYPGYKFKIVDAVITNFHFPRSTLLLLVSAFAGRDFIFRAYEEAIRMKYRFFSFGDAMFINR